MDIATISAAYEGLKIGKSLLTSIYELKIEADTKAKVAEVMSKLGDAQDALFAMREELFRLQSANADLKKSIADYESWDKRLSEYSLAKTAGGAVVYEYCREPKHYACPSCIGKEVIEILQDNRTDSGKFRCVGCDAEYPINPRTDPPDPKFPPIIRTVGRR